MKKFSCSRRDFIKYGLAAGAATVAVPSIPGIRTGNKLDAETPARAMSNKEIPKNEMSDLVMVTGAEPEILVQRAIDELGGIKKFISHGDKVFLKPNISWDRPPETAANSNPLMVAAVVKMCLNAGAKEVVIADRSCNEAKRCYVNTKIEEYASNAGASVRYVMDSRFREVAIQNAKKLNSWEMYKDALEADVFINMPVAKHHNLSNVSLALKNLMGLLGGNRGSLHNDFPEKIVDVASVLKPNLVILDAYRMLMANGPQGGNLQDVQLKKTVVVGINQVSVDAIGSTLFGLKPDSLAFLVEANNRGLGEINPEKLHVKTVNLAG